MSGVLGNKGQKPHLEFFAIYNSCWRWQNKTGTGCTKDKENTLEFYASVVILGLNLTQNKNERNFNQCHQIKKMDWYNVPDERVEIDVKWETFSQNEKKLCAQKANNIGIKHYKYC